MRTVDKIAQEANRSRSSRGSSFEEYLSDVFSRLKRKGEIKDFVKKPSIFDGEFNPDFLIIKNSGKIICIDATTTARTDRLRAKQWDAYGTKLFFREIERKNITAYTVVGEPSTNKREKDNFRHCKEKCKLPHSALDDTVSLKELLDIIRK